MLERGVFVICGKTAQPSTRKDTEHRIKIPNATFRISAFSCITILVPRCTHATGGTFTSVIRSTLGSADKMRVATSVQNPASNYSARRTYRFSRTAVRFSSCRSRALIIAALILKILFCFTEYVRLGFRQSQTFTATQILNVILLLLCSAQFRFLTGLSRRAASIERRHTQGS
jgi:hypothetical protein